ncbi:hypothetical protein SKAU_G00065870 [Synaphobranchus kaupii]|uniref:Uncharacterized protein n=1 Tax=Synaphobranchus kaupii TaxID=118154 RepID=A0A9Q1JB86_SYNKA|nr:hypothetical protein SKAU_G00065870 [Synaphobranchus kaupii]
MRNTRLTASRRFLSAADTGLGLQKNLFSRTLTAVSGQEAEITDSLTHSNLPRRDEHTAGCLLNPPPERESRFTGRGRLSKCTRSLPASSVPEQSAALAACFPAQAQQKHSHPDRA